MIPPAVDWNRDMLCVYCGSIIKYGMEYAHPDAGDQEAFRDALTEEEEENLVTCSWACWNAYMEMVYGDRYIDWQN